jgi:hypothetical protein
MRPDELAKLALDIKEHGLREPIRTHSGRVGGGGRSRYLACKQVGVEPKFLEWDGKGSLVAFVMSENVRRRHLTSTQRAVIGEAAEEAFRTEAAARRRSTQNNKRGAVPEKVPEQEKGESREKAATATGTNGHYITDGKAIRQAVPELIPLMRDGKASIKEAKSVTKLPPDDPKQIVKRVQDRLYAARTAKTRL